MHEAFNRKKMSKPARALYPESDIYISREDASAYTLSNVQQRDLAQVNFHGHSCMLMLSAQPAVKRMLCAHQSKVERLPQALHGEVRQL